MNETLAELNVEQHPDKTLIGRINRGFDFLGYVFSATGLEVAAQAVEHCVERVTQLYERGADLVRIGAYVRCWKRWARSGLGGLIADLAERAVVRSNAYWLASSGPNGRCRRAYLRLRNAASARPIAQAIPASTALVGSGTDAEFTQVPGMGGLLR